MKTKLDERLEIKADFEVLESNSPANMPVNVKHEAQYVRPKNNELIVQANVNMQSASEAISIDDIFAKAKKIEDTTKAREDLSKTVARCMPYFYCR